MRDRAATNNVAVRTLKVLYPNCVDIGCFSHTLDHVGEKFQTPVLEEFLSAWISLFSHSPKNKGLWLEQTGRSMRSYSATKVVEPVGGDGAVAGAIRGCSSISATG